MFSSIKTKIIVFYMAVLFVILSILAVFLYFSLKKIVYESIDSSIVATAEALATLINEPDYGKEFRLSDEMEYSLPKAKDFFQVRRSDGTIVETSESLKGLNLPLKKRGEQISLDTIFVGNTLTRLITFRFLKEGNKKGRSQSFIIQYAEDIGKQITLLRSYRIILLFSMSFIMAISALGGLLIARKALIPIKKISEVIDRISESNLSERIPLKNVLQELKMLAISFNHTFDRLESSFNRQKQFVADASHELRTPLAVILSQGEVALRRKQRSVEEYKDSLVSIVGSARIMSKTVQKLLIIARLGDSKIELNMEMVSLNKIIQKTVKLLTTLAGQKDIDITILTNEQFVIRGNHAELLEVFFNIIDNAIKYNIPHGKINISVRKEPDFIITEIEDTGIGIPEEDLERVFDRFYRVDKVRSRQTGGIGLGLSICKEIVKSHQGRVEIKSRLGEGTVVSVWLRA